MNVAVLGLWHLGSVTAAATAAAGHRVRAWDPETSTVIALEGGTPPVQEPGLAALLKQQIERGMLSMHRARRQALAGAEIIWITFDTPVDADDHADTAFVVDQVIAAMADAEPASLFLLSSQLPIGTARTLEAEARARRPESGFAFACSPENLRLGKALEVFSQPDRVIIGARTEADRLRLTALFAPITDRLEWMSVESA
jgi:UDPglucose 6-dehydrogenase